MGMGICGNLALTGFPQSPSILRAWRRARVARYRRRRRMGDKDVLGTSQAASRSMTALAREAALFVAGSAHADAMVCRSDAGVTHCEAPLRHYRVTGTRDGNRTYSRTTKAAADDRGGRTDHRHLPLKRLRFARFVSSSRSSFASASMSACKCPRPPRRARGEGCPRELGYNEVGPRMLRGCFDR